MSGGTLARSMVASLAVLAGVSPRLADAQVAGTYRLLLCRSTCGGDSAGAYARGTLVLSDTLLKDKGGKPITIRFRQHPANGCFAADAGTSRDLSYATIRKATVLDWARLPGSRMIAFQLYQSPDAQYVVTLKRSGGRLEGEGRQVGYGIAASNPPPDSILAIYLGPPRPSVCPWFD